MNPTRRQLLTNALCGAGLWGLRSLATGIPAAYLMNPRRAFATPAPAVKPQFIILSSSGDGDPIGTNAPGTYLDPNVVHPMNSSMTPTTLMLGGQPWTAAQPWSQLATDMLAQTCFFHHATYTQIHSDEQLVMSLEGYTSGGEMFVSLLASQLATALGTVRPEPIVLGPRNATETLFYQGVPQPTLLPSVLADLFGNPPGVLGQLSKLRDQDLDALNAYVKESGTPAQAAFVDQYATSQTQLRAISETLLGDLEAIPDDSVSSQITAAITLIRMNVSPVVSIHIPFGADNHADANLQTETNETVSGIASLQQLWTQLVQYGLQDKVSFLSFNVFGRTMGPGNGQGRAHNENHHMALMCGAPFRSCVIGGIEPVQGDYGASSIDSTTGAAVKNNGGDVSASESLQAMALTFGQGVGVDPAFLSANISFGKVVPAALAAT